MLGINPEKKWVIENPWAEVKISVPPKQPAKPFTLAEIKLIVQKCRIHPALSHYANYIEFKFGVGLRTSEAAALLWRHCSEECDRMWIGETVKRDKGKAAQRKKDRTVPLPLTIELQQILLNRRQSNFQPDDPTRTHRLFPALSPIFTVF
ncbi:hypothetical protein QUA20_28105 [Microcoleus sp. Pol7_A1]|uniref:hypothetical protein n=1 Tax=Microcoleus sp. Pol7_A1 TaxID=2818893 RepID=UPI002FD07D61